MLPLEKLDYTLHWIWSCQLQISRLSQSTLAEWNLLKGNAIERRKVFSATSYDEHIIAVAAKNLIRSIVLTCEDFPQLTSAIQNTKAIDLLRNIYEHWDEVRAGKRSKSAQKFAVNYPQSRAFSITYTPDGPVLAGILPLNDFLEQLTKLENLLLKLESQIKNPESE